MKLQAPPLSTPLIEASLILHTWREHQSMCAVKDKLFAVVAEETGTEGVTTDSKFEDLGLDSLEFINLLLVVDNAFKIRIPDACKVSLETVGDLLTAVQELAA